MDAIPLITNLKQPAAYPHPVEKVAFVQTHISLVFLAGSFVYKIKKPVQLGFLDFSTPEKRHYYCQEEVRLNRRLAPHVYLGVVPVVKTVDGVRFEGDGEIMEWAVKMRRLPDEATLEHRLMAHQVTAEDMENLARRIAQFHTEAETNEHIVSYGHFETVAKNARENFSQSQAEVGRTVHPDVFDRVRTLTEGALSKLRPLIEQRVEQGKIRDTHGDLRLDHVYFFPDHPYPEDVVILDCIEFNERFRYADPISDMAFLVMDLHYHGRRDLAQIFTQAYLHAAGEQENHSLVAFYTAYRAMVRAKVEGMKAEEGEVPAEEQQQAVSQARAHWLLALEELEQPASRPCLVLIGGPPGAGKSSLAKALAEQATFDVIRTDVVRKEMAANASPSNDTSQNLYTPEAIERIYSECLRRAGEGLFQGKRMLIDASFRQESHRQQFLQLAKAWGVPACLLMCRVSPAVARERIAHRQNDASDADWQVFKQAWRSWESTSPKTQLLTELIDANGSPEEVLGQGKRVLEKKELV